MNKNALLILLAVLLLVPGVAVAGFKDNGNGTVTDMVTSLMWQKCSFGQNNDATCSGTAVTSTFEAAISYCETLSLGGFTDWRLPNIKVLRSVADSAQSSPAINTTVYPGTQSLYYWSSTTVVGVENFAWSVYFGGYVLVTASFKTDSAAYVRCVR